METSSPLAAIGPHVSRHFHDNFGPVNCFSDYLRPLQQPPDYSFPDTRIRDTKSAFSECRTIPSSSPSESLAVDLSQNFTIGRSPQPSTPRRNLFATRSTEFRNNATPSVPSSSPAADHGSMMEVSPLPHKPAHSQDKLDSPSLEPSPMPPAGEDTPTQAQEDYFSRPVRSIFPQVRRKSNVSRPALRKGYSTNGIFHKGHVSKTSDPSSSFGFGPSCKPSVKPALEAFMESPPSERKLPPSQSTPTLPGIPMPKLVIPYNGSPVGGMRRASQSRPAPGTRVGLGRRTQSLQCEHDPFKPVRQEKRTCTEGNIRTTPLESNEIHDLKLPHFRPNDDPDGFPRITSDTLIEIMHGKFNNHIEDSKIIDCRFEYEFDGGHIEGAHNFNDKDDLAAKLFDADLSTNNKALIFHCEYSAHRAPLMAKYIRQRDRTMNEESYPNLTYPQIYILDGGYSTFFKLHRNLCFPQNYVEMKDKEFGSACKRGMAKVNRRTKLSRAQTYAFGQGLHLKGVAPRQDCEESPFMPSGPAPALSAPLDMCTIDSMDVDFAQSIAFESPIQAHSAIEPRMPRRFETWT